MDAINYHPLSDPDSQREAMYSLHLAIINQWKERVEGLERELASLRLRNQLLESLRKEGD